MDTVLISLLPLLFIVLILITYLNVVESKRIKTINENLTVVADYIKKISEKYVGEEPPKE